MAIIYQEKSNSFMLNTPNTSYVIGIADAEKFVGHAYYGERLSEDDVTYLMRTGEAPFTPDKNSRDRLSFLDCFPQEYPTQGIGDYRESAIVVKSAGGHNALQLNLTDYRIYRGKEKLQGLPATWGSEEDTETLELTLEDKVLHVKAILSYSIFEGIDAVVRSVRIVNAGTEPVMLEKVMSASIDMDDAGYDKIILHGSWARERYIDRTPVNHGVQSTSSLRGESGHQQQPFMALLSHSTTQDTGDIYGMHLIYSGNCMTLADKGQFDNIRLMTGINPAGFSWKLNPGEEFQAPEAVLVYSKEGIGGMSRVFHDLYRQHLIRGEYRDKKRPILINNWEATYFDFNTEKIVKIAEKAASLGVEMMVLDDGWFGTRNDDNQGLGDWVVNCEKLPGGLDPLIEQINALGMKFGLWIEPEMVNENSQLYRTHPDWALTLPGRKPAMGRNQLVLDLSRPEVVDYLAEAIGKLLREHHIEYIKWDMNRSMSDVYSRAFPAEQQGEIMHRYMLGVYALAERLTQGFPEVLFEGCAGGGGRFDAGMLCYYPQIWCSDDTDAIERLTIQHGTSFGYPVCTMGAHVSACPNHQTGRTTPIDTRAVVAMSGTFGYELDLGKLKRAECTAVKNQIKRFKRLNDLIRTGDYYRLTDPAENAYFTAWQFAAEDGSEALLNLVVTHPQANPLPIHLCFRGLEEDAVYELDGIDYFGSQYAHDVEDGIHKGMRFSGSTLLYAGLVLPQLFGDYPSVQLHLTRKG